MKTEEKILHVKQLSRDIRLGLLDSKSVTANALDTIADILMDIVRSTPYLHTYKASEGDSPVALGRNPNKVRVDQIPFGWRLCRTGEDLEKPWRIWEGECHDFPDGWGNINKGSNVPWRPENTYIVPDDKKPPQGHSFSCERCHDKKTVISTSHFGNIPCPCCGRQRETQPTP